MGALKHFYLFVAMNKCYPSLYGSIIEVDVGQRVHLGTSTLLLLWMNAILPISWNIYIPLISATKLNLLDITT